MKSNAECLRAQYCTVLHGIAGADVDRLTVFVPAPLVTWSLLSPAPTAAYCRPAVRKLIQFSAVHLQNTNQQQQPSLLVPSDKGTTSLLLFKDLRLDIDIN